MHELQNGDSPSVLAVAALAVGPAQGQETQAGCGHPAGDWPFAGAAGLARGTRPSTP